MCLRGVAALFLCSLLLGVKGQTACSPSNEFSTCINVVPPTTTNTCEYYNNYILCVYTSNNPTCYIQAFGCDSLVPQVNADYGCTLSCPATSLWTTSLSTTSLSTTCTTVPDTTELAQCLSRLATEPTTSVEICDYNQDIIS